jgi:hypothetical protein
MCHFLIPPKKYFEFFYLNVEGKSGDTPETPARTFSLHPASDGK